MAAGCLNIIYLLLILLNLVSDATLCETGKFKSCRCFAKFTVLSAIRHINLSKHNDDLFDPFWPSNIDFPTRDDLYQYINALKGVFEYYNGHKNDIVWNVAFGLFLANVNLQATLKLKPFNVTLCVRKEITKLANLNSNLLAFYRGIIEKDENKFGKTKVINSLFSNDTEWINGILKRRNDGYFHTDDDDGRSWHQFEDNFSDFKEYLALVFDYDRLIPSPEKSDECITSLVVSEIYIGRDALGYIGPRCSITKECQDILLNGSDYGYGLTHRLLLLLIARYNRGCSIFSPTKDQEMATRFCKTAYDEARYIAAHHYGVLTDLLMEQIAFCSLIIDVHFLRREWLNEVLYHQTSAGCFSVTSTAGKESVHSTNTKRWLMERTRADAAARYDSENVCDDHWSATSAAALSSGIRFIVENR